MLGKGICNAKNLRFLGVNACNLYQDDNLRRLLNGMIQDVNTKAAKNLGKQQKDSYLHWSDKYRKLLMDEETKEPPFTYSHKPERVKVDKKESIKQKLEREGTLTYGASIETLDFSDNDLNDSHG